MYRFSHGWTHRYLCKYLYSCWALIQIQPHFWATLHFAYFGLKHNVIGFLLTTLSSSDLWGGFVAAKQFLTGLNKFLLHFFQSARKALRTTYVKYMFLHKVADIQIQLHFWATLHFAYFGLKHNVIGFLLAIISSSDLWGGFVAVKKILIGLNKFLLHFFSKC